MERNSVRLRGTFEETLQIGCEVLGKKFYRIFLNVSRTSGTVDRIPILISNDFSLISYKGRKVEVKGKYRSYRQIGVDGKNHLILEVVAKSIQYVDEKIMDDNEVILDAYICKRGSCRKTPLGRKITDMILAVNSEVDASDFIPCIAWGRNAIYIADVPVGTHLKINGRIQSRKYFKKKADETFEERTAYEVSIATLEVFK